MKSIQRQRGYTLVELMIAVVALASVAGAAFGVYVLVHFIAKWW